MNAARPHTFRPRTALKPLCAVELKRSPRLKIAGSNQAFKPRNRRPRAIRDRTRRGS